MATLKSKNNVIIIVYLAIHFIIMYSILNSISSINEIEPLFFDIDKKYLPLIIAITSVFSTIINSIISADVKTCLIFLKLKNALPGCRAFSKYARTDPRIDLNHIEKIYGVAPLEPREQNVMWYRIYRDFSTIPTINATHGYWLLTRDLFSLQLLITAAYAGLFLYKNQFYASEHILTLKINMAFLTILFFSARNMGTGFVRNVLAEASVSKVKK